MQFRNVINVRSWESGKLIMSSFTIDKIFEIFVAIYEQNANFEPIFEQNVNIVPILIKSVIFFFKFEHFQR